MLDRIPAELKALPQWLLWRYEQRDGSTKPTKVPYQARTNRLASVDEPTHWCTFEEAVQALSGSTYSGIGFVFTRNDPYTFIDLDDTKSDKVRALQIKIKDFMASYTEWSPSGLGLHIIVKGSVPVGLKHECVEIYSELRYATFTGNVFNDAPIEDRSELVTQLWNEMRERSGRKELKYAVEGVHTEDNTDEQVYNMASHAQNGARFVNLWNGNWQQETNAHYGGPYPSASEADFAFVNMLQFWTKNRMQIERMFRMSGMGQRDKHQTKHSAYLVRRMIDRSFDMEPDAVDFERLRNIVALDSAAAAQEASEAAARLTERESPIGKPDEGTPYVLPPHHGLLADLALFIHAAMPIQVDAFALCGAIGFLAGVCGHAYNVGGAGLNQYIMAVGHTGLGKEGIDSGISKIVGDLAAHQFPAALAFRGPGEIASGPALGKIFQDTSSCVCVLGEFGYRLKEMSDERANGAAVSLLKSLLVMYGKSGRGNSTAGMAYSDTGNNVKGINSPALTIIGDTTPSTLYDNITPKMIDDGLLPRFLTFTYEGYRPNRNKQAHLVRLDDAVRHRLSSFVQHCLQVTALGQVVEVQYAPEATAMADEFEAYCTSQINSSTSGPFRSLWSRAWLKTAKLAALAAVGVNPHMPTITVYEWAWARNIVATDVQRFVKRFETGEIGKVTGVGEATIQMTAVATIIRNYCLSPFSTLGYVGKMTREDFHAHRMIPRSYLANKTQGLGVFNRSRVDHKTALDRALNGLVDMGRVIKCNTNDEGFIQRFGRSGGRAPELFICEDIDGLIAQFGLE